MSKKLIISEEEKKRILELHESSTNNKNLVSEEKNNSVIPGEGLLSLYLSDALEMEPKSGSGDELKLPAGTTLKKINKDTLAAKKIKYQLVNTYTGSVTRDLGGDVYYFCGTKEFKHSNDGNSMYWGENFSEDVEFKFKMVCDQPIQKTQNTQNSTQLSADDSALKFCVDKVLEKMEYSRDSFAQIFNSNPNNDKQLAQNLITTYNEQPSKKTSFSSECLATFKYSLGINNEEKKTSEKTNQKPIIKQPLVNQYIEKIKTDLQLPKDTTQQDTLNALMAKLNEIPVRK